MTEDSLMYNQIDLYELAKVRVIKYDVFTAPLRARKVVVPGRSGAYDYGAKYHDERNLTMEIVIDGEITPAQFDELKYTLSRKGRIILFDQLDRYYYGQAYDAAEVLEYYRHSMREFPIVFVCDPYAYALEPTVLESTEPIINTHGELRYPGTRRAPTRITIYNNGESPMHGIQILAREAR